jgi:hypothetical protein
MCHVPQQPVKAMPQVGVMERTVPSVTHHLHEPKKARPPRSEVEPLIVGEQTICSAGGGRGRSTGMPGSEGHDAGRAHPIVLTRRCDRSFPRTGDAFHCST